MQVKVRKLSEVKAELTITNTAQEVEEAYQAAYKNAQKNLKLPGFRKGKAPLELLEKHLGDRVVEDAVNKLLTQNMEKCLDTLEPEPISLPAMKLKDFKRHKGAAFVGAYDLSAKLTIGKYKKVEVFRGWPRVDTESIQKKLEAIQKFRVSLRSREEEEGAQMEDILELDLSIKHKDEKLFQVKKQKIVLEEKHMLSAMPEKLIGTKVGEERNFQLNIAEDFSDSKYAGKELDVHLKLWGCSYEELPPLDDEFARDCGEFENLMELKEKICSKLLEEAQKAIETKLKDEIIVQIVSDSKVVLPEQQVQRATEDILQSFFSKLKRNVSQKAPSMLEVARLIGEEPEKLQASLRKRSEAMLSQVLVFQEIGRLEEISLEEEDLGKILRERLPASVSAKDMDVKAVMEALEQKDQKEAKAVYHRAYIEKVIDWLYANAKIERGKELSISQLIADETLDKAVLDGVL